MLRNKLAIIIICLATIPALAKESLASWQKCGQFLRDQGLLDGNVEAAVYNELSKEKTLSLGIMRLAFMKHAQNKFPSEADYNMAVEAAAVCANSESGQYSLFGALALASTATGYRGDTQIDVSNPEVVQNFVLRVIGNSTALAYDVPNLSGALMVAYRSNCTGSQIKAPGFCRSFSSAIESDSSNAVAIFFSRLK